MVLWKGYHNFDFLQNLEGMHVFGMIHWPIRDGINLRSQRSLLVHQVSPLPIWPFVSLIVMISHQMAKPRSIDDLVDVQSTR